MATIETSWRSESVWVPTGRSVGLGSPDLDPLDLQVKGSGSGKGVGTDFIENAWVLMVGTRRSSPNLAYIHRYPWVGFKG